MAFLGYASILRESAFACLAVAEAFVWLWCAPVWIVEGDGFPNLAVAAAAAVAVASEGEVGAAVMAAVAAASEVDGTRSQAGALAASFAGHGVEVDVEVERTVAPGERKFSDLISQRMAQVAAGAGCAVLTVLAATTWQQLQPQQLRLLQHAPPPLHVHVLSCFLPLDAAPAPALP